MAVASQKFEPRDRGLRPEECLEHGRMHDRLCTRLGALICRILGSTDRRQKVHGWLNYSRGNVTVIRLLTW